jgi:hypothetical protein
MLTAVDGHDLCAGLDGSGPGQPGQYGAPQAADPGQQWQQPQPLLPQPDQDVPGDWAAEPQEQQASRTPLLQCCSWGQCLLFPVAVKCMEPREPSGQCLHCSLHRGLAGSYSV